MTIAATSPRPTTSTGPTSQVDVHTDRATRRRLREQDRRSAHLAELHAMADLLERAIVVLEHGWAQGVWYRPASHSVRAMTSEVEVVVDAPGPGVCLVGAIVQAAGGRRAVHTQLVQRTLDLTWHTLCRGPEEPVDWCPGPAVRRAQLRALTRWNDDRGRRHEEVVGLLHSARDSARAVRSGAGA